MAMELKRAAFILEANTELPVALMFSLCKIDSNIWHQLVAATKFVLNHSEEDTGIGPSPFVSPILIQLRFNG